MAILAVALFNPLCRAYQHFNYFCLTADTMKTSVRLGLMLLMIAAIVLMQVEPLPFLLGYIAIYAPYWGALKTGFPWN